MNTEEKNIEELSNAEASEGTSLKYEEKLAKETKRADNNYKFFHTEKQKRIDLEDENKRLKEKLEEKSLQDLRSMDFQRKSKDEQNNLAKILFGD